MTKISIITPAYNAAQYIGKCIESIANSNYDLTFVEHIIVDDGSTDDTAKICKNYAVKYKHIKFYSKSNGNWGSVINYVKHNKLLNGDYVLILDSDDQVTTNAFLKVNECQKNDIVIGNFGYWNGSVKTKTAITYSFILKHKFYKKNKFDYLYHLMHPCCTYVKKQIFYQMDDLLEKVSYQDCIYFSQAQTLSRSITHIPKTLALYWYNREGNSMSLLLTGKQFNIWGTNLLYYEKNQLFDLFVTQLVYGSPSFIDYLLEKNLKFHFFEPRLKLNGYTWWQRIHIKKIFNKKIKFLLK